jgi:DNA-directed RNA polymerase subunit RPC12/RpoP
MEDNKVTLNYGCPMCQPQTQEEFVSKPVTIKRSLNSPKDFDCPQCGSQGHYQFRQWEGSEHIQWAIDDRMSFKYIYDCSNCGGKLTEYVTIGRTKDHSVCRHCGNVRTGNLSGYR